MTTVTEVQALIADDSAPTKRNLKLKREVKVWSIRIGLLVIVLAGWQFVAAAKLLNPVFIGEPTKIAQAFGGMFRSDLITVDLFTTLEETLIGFAIGSVLGIAAGFVLARFETLNRAVQPLLSALNSLPRVALGPIFIIWFGLGVNSKIALSVSLVFFILVINTIAALTNADRDALFLARSLGASERTRLLRFVLPGAVPTLVAGLELGLIYSFLGAVTGEIIGGTHGLGVKLTYDANVFATNEFFAILLLLAIITTVLVQAIRFISGRLLRWHAIEMGSARED